jgi:NAD(P)-dependent dehydrogenase (short-subunit alcohol dehydrogenase family)
MPKLEQKIALVTGAASGIGAATATRFAREGATVLLADINAEAASTLASTLLAAGLNVQALTLDVTLEAAWEAAFAHIAAHFGRLDVLMNNAGVSFGKPIVDMDLAEWQRVMNVNLASVMLGTKYALRLMLTQKSGAIVNIASASGIKAVAGASAYCTSKAGVIMLTKAPHWKPLRTTSA